MPELLEYVVISIVLRVMIVIHLLYHMVSYLLAHCEIIEMYWQQYFFSPRDNIGWWCHDLEILAAEIVISEFRTKDVEFGSKYGIPLSSRTTQFGVGIAIQTVHYSIIGFKGQRFWRHSSTH